MSAPTKPASLSERLEAAVPEADSLNAAAAVVKAVPRRPFDLERARRDLVRAIAGEVEQTGEWPADAAERWIAIDRQAEEASAHGEVRHRVAERLKFTTRDAHDDATGPKVAILRAELDEVLDEVARLDSTLGDVHDADAAIRAGVEAVTAWTALGVLVGRAREVFEVHKRLLVPRGSDVAVTYRYASLVPVRDAPAGERVLDDRTGQPTPLDGDRLRRLAVSDDEPWLPTPEEFRQAEDHGDTPLDEGLYDISPTVDQWDDDEGVYLRRH